ncbi:hypothetical protein, partial [Bacteroides caccae]|uniref:hypothetical protein n=1 Tax=Bacteroides caccae TaxID=47678 RepID=UPI0034A21BF1
PHGFPSFRKKGWLKAGVVGRNMVYSFILKKGKIIIFPTTSPYGYSSFQKEEKLCRKLIYNSKNYKVTTKK